MPRAQVADASPIAEVLNVAWAQHEISADPVSDAFEFLENNVLANQHLENFN